MTNAVTSAAASSDHAATTSSKPAAARTRLLLEGPIVATLLRLAAPNVVVNVVLIAVTATGDIDDDVRRGDRKSTRLNSSH